VSAAVVVLPQVWATCCAAPTGPVTERKGPHRLYLLGASAAEFPRTVRALPEPEFAFYRKYTEAMLQRYMKLSLEAGRVPSLFGRELFRGSVSYYEVHSFDDVVIFVKDVGACIDDLSPGQQHLVRRIALYGYTQPETAAMLGIGLRTVIRRYNEALDRLTCLFIARKMLTPLVEQ
jgi:hypothetical protein